MFQFLRLFYSWLNGGDSCIVCGKTVFLYPVCKACSKKYFSVEKILNVPRCEVCGKELIATKGRCTACKENPILKNVDKALPMFSYRLWNKELLFRWKISGERSLSFFYSSKVNDVLKTLNFDAIVPVPPRKGKIQKNGWDQIDELCNFLEFFYKYKVLRLLERNSVTQQKKLNRNERLETIKNAYSYAGFNNPLPETVCLIDDVCTTGATIESCASLLKSAGIKTVFVLTLYIVD